MLEKTINTVVGLAPEVYIDSTEIEQDKITVFYHVENDYTNWFLDDNVLQNINIHVLVNDTGSIESLQSFKNKALFINNSLYGKLISYTTSSNIRIDAYCGNKNIKGKQITENVMNFGLINSSSYQDTSLKYINKHFDFRLFELQPFQTSSKYEYTPTQEELYISYTTDKKANIGFVFNLEQFLYQSSQTYRNLSSEEYYKQLIFSGSNLDSSDVLFYRKNLTKNLDFEPIFSKVKIYKTDVQNLSSSYIVTITDENDNFENYDEYGIKVKIFVDNFAEKIFNQNINKKLESILNYLSYYKSLFENTLHNNNIEDKNGYIFVNKFPSEIENVKILIEDLSLIYAFYNKKYLRDQYITLFASILHPLTTRIEYIEKLINNITLLYVNLQFLTNNTNIDKQIDNKENIFSFIYEKEFKYSGLDNKEIYHSINYNYEAGYGYEIMSMDTTKNRFKNEKKGFDVYTILEKKARRNLEYKKFFSSEIAFNTDVSDYFSFSGLDLGSNYYNLTIGQPTSDFSFYNDIYITLKQYNNKDKYTRLPEYYYYDLLNNNVYIKSVGVKNNVPKDNYFPSVLYDQNEESQIASLKYLTDTGMNVLFYIMDKAKFIPVNPKSSQYEATLTGSDMAISNFVLDDQIFSDPMAKAKAIIHYNGIYKDVLKMSGSSYSIYSFEEDTVNPIFTKHLKLFNRYYIQQNISQEAITGIDTLSQKDIYRNIEIPELSIELLFNQKSSNLNRNTQSAVMLITTSDI